tara:strand:+ start:3041 stop:3697 length:657 start_codon:yes stop_codon:yes gene_type:complete
MANVNQQLDIPAIPSLGSSGIVYSQDVQNQNNGILRLFFTRLLNSIHSVFGPRGGKYLNNPHGAFQDSTDQVAASTTVAYPVTFNTTDFSNGVTIASGSRITVADAGIWNLQFSLQFTNTTNASQDVDVWFRVNGTNIANSNSRYGLAPRKGAGDPFHVIMALNYFASLNATDYIEIMWRTTDTGVSIEQYAAGTSPTRPAIPSAIATMSFVSNLPNL